MTRLNERRCDIIIVLLYHFLEVTKQQLNQMSRNATLEISMPPSGNHRNDDCY